MTKPNIRLSKKDNSTKGTAYLKVFEGSGHEVSLLANLWLELNAQYVKSADERNIVYCGKSNYGTTFHPNMTHEFAVFIWCTLYPGVQVVKTTEKIHNLPVSVVRLSKGVRRVLASESCPLKVATIGDLVAWTETEHFYRQHHAIRKSVLSAIRAAKTIEFL